MIVGDANNMATNIAEISVSNGINSHIPGRAILQAQTEAKALSVYLFPVLTIQTLLTADNRLNIWMVKCSLEHRIINFHHGGLLQVVRFWLDV